MASIAEMKQAKSNNGALTLGQQVSQKVSYLDKRKELLGAGIPGHMTVEREIRTATVMLMQSKDLQAASPESFYTAVSIAVNSGVGLGSGKGYLIAYKGNCQYVPGWKGLVDLVSRSGRGTVWTGIVHKNDHFEYALGDSPFLTHRPGDNEDHKDITHYYSIGRVKGSEWPIIEVWSVGKVIKHLNAYNKQGTRHYAHKDENNMEMYARKVVLLQVIKYMPQSQDIENAVNADRAAETGKNMTIEGNFMYINEDDQQDSVAQTSASNEQQNASSSIRSEAPDLPGDDEYQGGDQNQATTHRGQESNAVTYAQVADRLEKASDIDMLNAEADLIKEVADTVHQEELRTIWRRRLEQLEGGARQQTTRPARRQMNLD